VHQAPRRLPLQQICVHGEHTARLSDFGATNSECCPIRAVSAANPQRPTSA